jgi:hypothetical protein
MRESFRAACTKHLLVVVVIAGLVILWIGLPTLAFVLNPLFAVCPCRACRVGRRRKPRTANRGHAPPAGPPPPWLSQEMRGAYLNLTTELSEWPHCGHSKVRLSCPGLSGSIRASIIGVPH